MTTRQHQRGRRRPSPRRLSRTRRRMAGMGFALLALLALVSMFTAVGWLAPGATDVARADTTTNDQKVAVFEDVTVGPDETWDNVVVVGGDALISGTVKNVVVVVGGDLVLTDSARVGSGVSRDDAAVVSVFGDVTIQPGATVRGRTVDVGGGVSDTAASNVTDPILRPWRTGSILNWIWSTVFLAVVAVIATAIAPRQVAVVRDRVGRHFFSSLGWGALGAIIAVPIITIALVITVIGIILVVPWLGIALPIMSLFGLVAVGAWVGRLILGAKEDKRETVMLAAVLGLVIINISRWIPVAWIVIIGILWLVGFGATYVAIWVWLRDRRRRRREAAAQEQAAWATATSLGGVAGPGGVPGPDGPYPSPSGPSTGSPPAAGAGMWPVAGAEAEAQAQAQAQASPPGASDAVTPVADMGMDAAPEPSASEAPPIETEPSAGVVLPGESELPAGAAAQAGSEVPTGEEYRANVDDSTGTEASPDSETPAG